MFFSSSKTQVDLRIAPATETLQKLVDNNEAATFDFAFIDADKVTFMLIIIIMMTGDEIHNHGHIDDCCVDFNYFLAGSSSWDIN